MIAWFGLLRLLQLLLTAVSNMNETFIAARWKHSLGCCVRNCLLWLWDDSTMYLRLCELISHSNTTRSGSVYKYTIKIILRTRPPFVITYVDDDERWCLQYVGVVELLLAGCKKQWYFLPFVEGKMMSLRCKFTRHIVARNQPVTNSQRWFGRFWKLDLLIKSRKLLLSKSMKETETKYINVQWS